MQVEQLEFAVVGAGRKDPQIDAAITEVLTIVRDKMGLHFVFATEVRPDAPADPGRELSEGAQWYLLDSAFCRDLVMPHWTVPAMTDAPAPSGCFTVPVVLADGRVIGVLYAPRHAGDAAAESQRLRQAELSSQLIARRIDERCRAAAPVRATGPGATVSPLLPAATAARTATDPHAPSSGWALAA